MNRNAVTGLAIACLIAGAVFLALYGAGQASASRGRDWTQKLGTIDQVTPEGVTYRYEANERAHTMTDKGAQSGRYRQGQRVVIYVNPANPAESLLELGRRPDPWTAATSAVLLLIGAGLGGYALTLRRNAGPAVNVKDSPARTPPPPANLGRGSAPPLSRLRPPPSIPRKAPEDDDTTATDAR
jgi:hypothetical protein